MSLTYAIADLHGRFDLLQKAYEKMTAHARGEPATVVHLGDYVDRGPHSKEVVAFLMDETTCPRNFTRHTLKGNHEQVMVCCLRGHVSKSVWIEHGGEETLNSYDHKVPEDHVEFLHGLPLYFLQEHRLFVHAGALSNVLIQEQPDDVLLKMYYRLGNVGGYFGRHVVHGHHANSRGPLLYAQRTNLDTMAHYHGRLVVGVFDDDKPGGPVDKIEVLDFHNSMSATAR